MKLQQNQVWKQGDLYIRIIRLERLAVEYKLLTDFAAKKGQHHHATKKEFCRLLKGATLLSQDQIREIAAQPQPAAAPTPEAPAGFPVPEPGAGPGAE